MKTLKSAYIGIILSFLTWLCVDMTASKGQNLPPAPGADDSVRLPGSSLRAEDLASKSDAIFVGQIVEMGFPVPSAPDSIPYGAVKVKVLQILRGSVDAQIYVQLNVSGRNHEDTPTAGSAYIFFVRKAHFDNAIQNIVSKLLPATDDNITKVKALISAAPAPK